MSAPTIRRTTARVVPVNRHGEVLVLFGCDPQHPESPFWFTIGGAAEADETLTQAGARELSEETGIEVTPEQLVGPYASGLYEFSWGGMEIANESHFYAVRVDDVAVTFDGLEELEVGTIWEARWWRPSELQTESLARPDLRERLQEAVLAVGA